MHTETLEHKFPKNVCEKVLGDPEKYASMLRPDTDDLTCKVAKRPVQVIDVDDLDGADLGDLSAVYVIDCFKAGQRMRVVADMDSKLCAAVGIQKVSQKVASADEDMLEI